MNFLVIAQDLRISGTSEGIVSRSFLAKLRMAYPEAIIDVLYLKIHKGEDELDLLPVNSIVSQEINLKAPFFIKWLNRVYSRVFSVSVYDNYIHKLFAKHISNINHEKYSHVFVRSSGVNHETILATKNLSILDKSILNFHDPYPLFWYPGSKNKLTGVELFRLKKMQAVIDQASVCISPSKLLSKDLSFLYKSDKFQVLPHQYSNSVFNLPEKRKKTNKNKKVIISYHGSVQFGRNLDILLDAFSELISENLSFKSDVEICVRLKTNDYKRFKNKYANSENIIILEKADFSTSSYEQMFESDIIVILENGPKISNILVGKAPFVAFLKKPVLVLAPKESELRNIVTDEKYIANYFDKKEIKEKLKGLILQRLDSNTEVYPFGNYFSDDHFKTQLSQILEY
jgi:glycosyltransferase involved in cell wall biosynthesis